MAESPDVASVKSDSTVETTPDAGTGDAAGRDAKASLDARLDQEFSKGFDKGQRRAREKVAEQIATEHGVPLDTILTEWKAARENKTATEEKGNAEIAKLQREHAKALKEAEELRAAHEKAQSEVSRYRKTMPIRDAVTKANPKTPAYAAILEERISARTILDADGELTVLNADGTPAHRRTLDELVAEVVQEFPDLVNTSRSGTSSSPARGLTTAPRTGAPSRGTWVDAVRKTGLLR